MVQIADEGRWIVRIGCESWNVRALRFADGTRNTKGPKAVVFSTMIDLTGKTREEIEATLEDVDRPELIDMIVEMATLEQWFRPSEIARRRRMNVRDVREAMKAGKMGGYFRRAGNAMFASASGVAAWDRRFFVSANCSSKNGSGK